MRVLLGILFVIAFAFGCIRAIPLSFALRTSGISEQDIGWRQARGTIWNGQVTGLTLGHIAAGHAELKLRITDLLGNGLAFDARWAAPYGRAAAIIRPSQTGVAINEATAEIYISHAPFVDSRLRDIGATLRAEKLDIDMGAYGCETASGTIRTDAITLAGQQYGRTWPELSGGIHCENRTLITELTGKGRAGETFRLSARLDGAGRFNYIIDAKGVDFEAQTALTSLGFVSGQNGLSYGNDNGVRNAQ